MDKEKSIYTREEQALIDGVECILDYSEVPDEEDYQEYLRLIERGRQAEALAEKEKGLNTYESSEYAKEMRRAYNAISSVYSEERHKAKIECIEKIGEYHNIAFDSFLDTEELVWDREKFVVSYEQVAGVKTLHPCAINLEKEQMLRLAADLGEITRYEVLYRDAFDKVHTFSNRTGAALQTAIESVEKEVKEFWDKEFAEQRKDKNYVPIPDYAKVGEVFKTQERFLLVMNNGTLMPLENGSDETITLWRQKLKNLGKEVELNLELGNFSKEQVDYTYDCPLPEGVNHMSKRKGR